MKLILKIINSNNFNKMTTIISTEMTKIFRKKKINLKICKNLVIKNNNIIKKIIMNKIIFNKSKKNNNKQNKFKLSKIINIYTNQKTQMNFLKEI